MSHRPLVPRERARRLLDRVRGAELLRLVGDGDGDVAAAERLLDLVATLADDDDALVGAERVDAVEEVQEQRPAGDRVKHLVGVGSHARPLPRGKDDNGETALVGHAR